MFNGQSIPCDGGESTPWFFPHNVMQAIVRDDGGGLASWAPSWSSPEVTQDIPGGEGGDSTSWAPSWSPPEVTQDFPGGEASWAPFLSAPDVTKIARDDGDSTGWLPLLSQPDVTQETAGDEGGDSASWAWSPPDVEQDIPSSDSTSRAPWLSQPDVTQNIPREEGGNSTTSVPCLSQPDETQPPLRRREKATANFCNECNKVFGRKQEFDRHLRETKRHGGPTRRCPWCGKLLSRNHTLTGHMFKSCSAK